MRKKGFLIVISVFIMIFLCGSVYAWDVTYEGDVLPDSDGWTLSEGFSTDLDGSELYVSNGILYMDTTRETDTGWGYRRYWSADSSKGFTLETRFRYTSGDLYVIDGFADYRCGVYITDGFLSLNGIGPIKAADNDFHIYRATFDGTVCKYYMDGEFIRENAPSSYSMNQVFFGDGSSSDDGGIGEWDYVRYSIDKAFPPGETSFKKGDTEYDGILQSNNVNDVFVYNTSNETGLWKVGGNIGKCGMEFDGDGDYVSIPFSSSLNMTGTSATLVAWAKISDLTDTKEDWMIRQGDSIYAMSVYNSRLYAYAENENCLAVGPSVELSDTTPNVWHQFAIAVDFTTDTVDFYQNGNLLSSSPMTGAGSGNSFCSSGSQPVYLSTSTVFLNGSLDEIQIFNRGLSSAEISSIYNRGLSNLKSNITDGLVGAWGFDDCKENRLWDGSYWSASGLNAFSAYNVNDENYASSGFHTDTAGVGSYLILDTEEGKSFTGVRITFYSTPVYATWNIQYSDDGSSWTNAYTGAGGNPISPGTYTYSWSDVGKHRYWRLYKTNSAAGGGYHTEVDFFETTADESGNNNYGTINKATKKEKLSWYKEGNANEKGAYFDGDGDRIAISDSPDLYLGSNDFTMSFWTNLKTHGLSGYDLFLVQSGDWDENNIGWGLQFDTPYGNGVTFYWSSDGTYQNKNLHYSWNPSFNKWYYVTLTNKDDLLSFYVDGVKIGSHSFTDTIFDSTYDLIIGDNPANFLSGSINGSIDNVRIYNGKGFTESEIKDLYSRELAGADTSVYDNDANLVGYWDFENSSDWYADKSGEGNDGTANGDVSVSLVDYLQDDGAAASVYDQAAVFDGVNDYVKTPFTSLSTPFSICMWFNPKTLKKMNIFSNYDNTGDDFDMQIDNDLGYYDLSIWTDQGSTRVRSTSTIKEGWQHMCHTLDSSASKIYMNGIHEASDSGVSATIDNGNIFMIGNRPNSNNMVFDGSIDEVMIFNKVLNSSEVNQIYGRGIINKPSNITSDLLTYYSFNGDYDDDSGNGNDGVDGNGVYLYGRTGSKEFPEKAYLVATDEGLDVIDAMDDSLWMRFKEGGVSPFTSNGNILSTLEGTGSAKWGSVTANKGAFYLGNSINWAAGLYRIDFIEEESYIYRNSGNNNYLYSSNIDDRNNRKGFTSSTSRPYIIGIPVNDVSVAEIDGNTYVAVATDGGVSIINESGNSVADLFISSQCAAGTTVEKAHLTQGDALYIMAYCPTCADTYSWVHTIYDASTKSTASACEDSLDAIYTTYNDTNTLTPLYEYVLGNGDTVMNDLYVTEGTSTVDSTSNTIYVATDAGVSVIQEKQGDESNGNVENYIKGPGKVSGQSAYFDGYDDWMNISHHNDLAPSELTVSVWIKPNEDFVTGEYQPIIRKDAHSINSVGFGYNLIYYNGALYSYYGTDADTSWDCSPGSAIDFPKDTWQHLVFTKDSTGARIYLNGTKIREFYG